MRSQYAAAPTPPPPTVSFGIGSITVAKAGTYSAYLQLRNRSGVTAFSPRIEFTVAIGQSVTLCIPAAVRQSGCDIHEMLILLSKTNIPSEAVVVATYPGFELDGVTQRSLPKNIVLSRDKHLELGKIVSSLTVLPQNEDLIHGMRRYVEEAGAVLAYNEYRSRWIPASPPSFSTYVATSQSIGGCDRDIADIEPSEVITPDYDASGSLSEPVKFWMVNDSAVATAQSIPSGTRVRLAVSVNGADYSSKFAGLMILTILGYVNIGTGVLDTSDQPEVGVQTFYQGDQQTNLILPKPLLPGFAFMFQVQVTFQFFQLNNEVLNGATIQFSPRFSTVNAKYDEGGELLGDYILATEKLRRVVSNGPGLNALALPGSGRVASYTFREVPTQMVVGFTPNTANQNCVITNNGVCFVSTIVPAGAVLRCRIGTVDGIGIPTDWSEAIALSPTTLLQVTVSHPSNIRSDYPDVIAGSADSEPNITRIAVFVESIATSIITRYEQLYTLGQSSSQFLVGAIAGVEIGNNLSSPPFDFGLYTPVSYSSIPITGNSTFTEGEYRVAIAYVYENTITSISHNITQGCIYEAGATLAQVFDSTKYWAPGVATLIELRSIPLGLVYPYQSRYVAEQNNPYRYDPTINVPDDGISVIKLNNTPATAPGRFILDDSATWYSGDGVPVSTLGSSGDYYLDTGENSVFAGTVWKKTTTNAWIDAGSIRGPQGIPGIPGLTERGEWNDTTFYVIGDLVSHNNSVWVAQEENIDSDPAIDNTHEWRSLIRGLRNRGDYSNTVTYSYNDLVKDVGNSYIYINADPSTGNNTENVFYWMQLASSGQSTVYNPRGEYNNAATYSKFDLISFDGSSYIYINSVGSIGNTPPNTSYWQLQSQKGVAGSVSATGGIVFDYGAPPVTGSNQSGLYVDQGDIKVRSPSNGTITSIAVLDKSQTFTKTQSVATITLVDAPVIDTNGALSNKFKVTLGGNRSLANPSNRQDGTYLWHVYQDSTGGRSLTFGNAFKFPSGVVPVLSTTANAHDLLTCDSDGINLYCSLLKDLR